MPGRLQRISRSKGRPFDSTRTYASPMAQGDLPTPRGGFRRRRREKRQLGQLAEASQRHDAPRIATSHVRVVEGQDDDIVDDHADAPARNLERQEPDSSIDGSLQDRATGFHVRPVPIDQPIGE